MPVPVGAPAPDWLRDVLGARTVDEIRQEYEGRSRFVVEGLVHATTTLVYGLSEAGKTWLMVDMVTALVRGERWLGQPIHGGPHRCLILAADAGGVREYADRLSDGVGEGVLVTAPPPVDVERWQALAEHCVAAGLGVVVVDNWYAWTGALDVNSNRDVAAPLACLRVLALAGVAVVVVHHTNSTGAKPAGTHAIPAAFRHSLALTKSTGLKSFGNDAARADYWLIRDGGRVLDGGQGTNTQSLGERNAAATPAGQPKLSARQHRCQRILEALRDAPPEEARGGIRALGRYLHVVLPDDVGSAEAGRNRVKALIAEGLWALP